MPVTKNGVQWTELYDPGHMMREAFAPGAQVIERYAEVKWGERTQFVRDMVGWATGAPGRIIRSNPEPDLEYPYCYCMEAHSMEMYGNHGQDAQTTAFKANFARYRLVYRPVDYEIREDGDDDTLPELKRYVTRRRKWGFESQVVPNAQLQFNEAPDVGVLIPTPATKRQVILSAEYTLWRWPRSSIPFAAIQARSFQVNDANFDAFQIGGQVLTYAPEQVAFMGVDQRDYLDAVGDPVCDLIYILGAKAETWNKFPNKDFLFKAVVTVNGGLKPFTLGAFGDLFTPS